MVGPGGLEPPTNGLLADQSKCENLEGINNRHGDCESPCHLRDNSLNSMEDGAQGRNRTTDTRIFRRSVNLYFVIYQQLTGRPLQDFAPRSTTMHN